MLSAQTWQRPPVFDWLQKAGSIPDAEMYRTFNCGIGMTVCVAAEHCDKALQHPARARRATGRDRRSTSRRRRRDHPRMTTRRLAAGALPIAILISGRGSNMQVIAERAARGDLPVDVRVVVSDQPAAGGLAVAARAEHSHAKCCRRATSPDRAVLRRRAGRLLAAVRAAAHRARGLHAHSHVRTSSTHSPAASSTCIPRSCRSIAACTRTGVRSKPAMRCMGSACISSPRNSTAARSFFRRGSTCCRTTRKRAFQREFSSSEHRIYPQAIDWFARGRLRAARTIAPGSTASCSDAPSCGNMRCNDGSESSARDVDRMRTT